MDVSVGPEVWTYISIPELSDFYLHSVEKGESNSSAAFLRLNKCFTF